MHPAARPLNESYGSATLYARPPLGAPEASGGYSNYGAYKSSETASRAGAPPSSRGQRDAPNARDPYIAELKNRLEVLEKVVLALQSTTLRTTRGHAIPDRPAKATTSTARPYTDSAQFDKAQALTIKIVDGGEYRKLKDKVGITKGAVLLVCKTARDNKPNRLAIQSHCLLNTLTEITGHQFRSQNVLLRPFKLLLHHEQAIRQHWMSLRDQEASSGAMEPNKCLHSHMGLLVRFMDENMSDIFHLRNETQLARLKEVDFEDLWHVFQPGQLAVCNSRTSGAYSAYRVLHVTGGRSISDVHGKSPPDTAVDPELADGLPEYAGARRRLPTKIRKSPLIVDCVYIDFDGQFYGPKPRRFVMLEYTGKKLITSLDVFPLKLATEDLRESVRQDLLSRGDKYEACIKAQHITYAGRTVADPLTTMQQRELQEMTSTCILDHQFFLQGRFVFADGCIEYPSACDEREFSDTAACDIDGCMSCTDLSYDADIDLEARSKYMESDAGIALLDPTPVLTPETKLLLSERLYGFAVSNRKWHALAVSRVDLEQHNLTTFEDLVLPAAHKDTLSALMASASMEVQSPSTPHLQFDRVPKGRGLCILLHGPPGTGKTSTAEAMAHRLRRPLFPMTCGDLGDNAALVEQRLDEYFHLAQRWHCILLLDEADAFMSQRTDQDHARTSIVSVFLRALEHYSGILILTTNRVGAFDSAFRSRIHVSLYYPPFDKAALLDVWQLHLSKFLNDYYRSHDSKQEHDIMDFFRKHGGAIAEHRAWNAREVKNLFQNAVALARAEGGVHMLSSQHFVDVAGMSDSFEELLSGTRVDHSAAHQAARLRAIRFDDYKSFGQHV